MKMNTWSGLCRPCAGEIECNTYGGMMFHHAGSWGAAGLLGPGGGPWAGAGAW